MNEFWQTAAVALLVTAAFGYTTWSFMPWRWRQRILRRSSRQAKSSHCASACAACQGCASNPAPAEARITWQPRANRLSSKASD